VDAMLVQVADAMMSAV